jgi:hypothetical protein
MGQPEPQITLIPNFVKYFADVDGNIWSNKRKSLKKLALHKKKNGYLFVTLNGKGYAVHRLILLTFRGKRPKGLESRHLNNNKTDNRLKNLLWGTRRENACDSAKLTAEEVRQIRDLKRKKYTLAEIAILYCNQRSKKPFDGDTGARLAKLAGIDFKTLSNSAVLRNLFDTYPGPSAGKDDHWDPVAARSRARRVRFRTPTVVLAGRRVSGAFGLADISYCTIFFYRGHRMTIIPHPSGGQPPLQPYGHARTGLNLVALSPRPSYYSLNVKQFTVQDTLPYGAKLPMPVTVSQVGAIQDLVEEFFMMTNEIETRHWLWGLHGMLEDLKKPLPSRTNRQRD